MKKFLVAAILLPGLCFANYAYTADWQPVRNSQIGSRFDASRISYVSPSIIRVWEKFILPDKLLDKTKGNDNVDLVADYAYTIVHAQVDCRRRSVGYVSLNHYNSRGFVAVHYDGTTYEESKTKMESVLPNSEGEDLVKTVCKFVDM